MIGRRSISFRAACLVLPAMLAGCNSLQLGDVPLLSRTGLKPGAAQESSQPLPELDPATPQVPGAMAIVPAKQFSEFALAQATSVGELQFQPGDSIKVSVWGYPELDHTATVQPNGRITLPLVGEIAASGETVGNLRTRITDKLKPFTKVESMELRPGDSLTMEVWQRTELRHTATIEPNGTVTFPLAGRLPAAGRAIEDLRKETEARLRDHLRDARVTLLPLFANRRVLFDYHVSVLASRLEPRRVALVGEVNNQGMVEIRGSLRLVEALAQAQLRQTTAEMNSIVVIRNPTSGSPQYRMIRLADYFSGKAPDQNIFLQNDDIVVVPKTAIARAGDFVEQFFTRTVPVFNWWSAMWQARTASQSAETVNLINDSLRRAINAVTISPQP